MVYYSYEPLGEHRNDLQAAIVASTMANIWRPDNQRPYQTQDFMPKFEPDDGMDEAENWKAQLATVELLNAAFGGEDKRSKANGHTG